MTTKSIQKHLFLEKDMLHKLRHYLPSQAPLKDFIHHNTLHAFQEFPFHEALSRASAIFGYRTYLPLKEYRARFHSGSIHADIVERVIEENTTTSEAAKELQSRMLEKDYDTSVNARIGAVRKHWKDYGIHLDKLVHPILFRLLGSYLDQGISAWQFPMPASGFVACLREMERVAPFGGIFTTPRAKKLFLDESTTLKRLLTLLVGEEGLFEHYLFDQQCSHAGWAGMVAFLEENPNALLDAKTISLHDLIFMELLLEIEMLDRAFGEIWSPIGYKIEQPVAPLFAPTHTDELDDVLRLWQEAFEWSYYDQVLAGLRSAQSHNSANNPEPKTARETSFQAMFCIDDRECSFRRYVEHLDPKSQTFGTPGFFNVEFYFQPEHSKFHTKSCPAPVSPKFLIKEKERKNVRKSDAHYARHSHSLFRGWLISQTLGFFSAVKLLESVVRPSLNPASVHSFRHTDKHASLTIERDENAPMENGLFVGFSHEEMTDRVEGLLKSTGLVENFAPIVYLIGHGASSANNTHYAGYDCGACCGRPGSVNARVAAFMANHPSVRAMLRERGITIPESTRFVGALHDTTRDELEFFDDEYLSAAHKTLHSANQTTFGEALTLNAKERSRRFELLDTLKSPEKVHESVKLRSVSLFEPRPELNHATNTLCIIGRRDLTKHLFLDRRAFMNSYNYALDKDGKYLFGIMKAAAPVCGGINLEYYFSRVDNQRLGAGTKLPHNVIGLIAVANGADGDLRPGLPSQMIEVHDPTRLMMVVEHFPEVVQKVIQTTPELFEWFKNSWIHLVALHPVTKELFVFKDEKFIPYTPLKNSLLKALDMKILVESSQENLPVYVLAEAQKTTAEMEEFV
ncbi:MAG: DUF2309 domain-containing protein [Candidatus Kapaibacterium sp.]|nr:MAG: DUF2309 domain-containing protein [Candidatus Kapabacteria bacterium]